VTTRLLILESPAERVTLSIYGFSPTADQKPILTPHLHTAVELEKEDWGWLHSWAGGIPSLLDLLNDDTPPSTRDKALDTLDLFTDIETILPQILDHPTALPFLLSLPSYPAQPLLYRLYADPTYALHPNLRHHLPHSHSLKKLVQGGRKEAWRNLRLGRGALAILAEGSGEDLLAIRKGTGRSNLSSLMEHTQLSATGDDQESRRSLELALDILDTPSLYDDPIAISYLAQPLPGLAVISRTRGSKRMLNIPSSRNRQVVKRWMASPVGRQHRLSLNPTSSSSIPPTHFAPHSQIPSEIKRIYHHLSQIHSTVDVSLACPMPSLALLGRQQTVFHLKSLSALSTTNPPPPNYSPSSPLTFSKQSRPPLSHHWEYPPSSTPHQRVKHQHGQGKSTRHTSSGIVSGKGRRRIWDLESRRDCGGVCRLEEWELWELRWGRDLLVGMWMNMLNVI